MRERRERHDPDLVAMPSEAADELVLRAKTGDIDAFAALYRASLRLVFANLYGRSGDRTLAEDLSADTYVRALRSIARFEGTSRDFVGWVMRIARNLFLDHVKSGRVRWETVVDELPTTPTTSGTEAEALAAVEGHELRLALEKLTPEQQEVVHLRFLQDLSIADVARITGQTEGAIKAMQFRALRSLARILADHRHLDDDHGADGATAAQ